MSNYGSLAEPVADRGGQPWSQVEDRMAAQALVGSTDLAPILGRSVAAVRQRRRQLRGGQISRWGRAFAR